MTRMSAAPLSPASPSASTGRLKTPPVRPAATRLASWRSAAFATRSRSGSPSGWRDLGPREISGPGLLLLDDDTPLSVREDAIAVAVLTGRQVVVLALLGRT